MTVILGLTGSFGSGKSTVAALFEDLGVAAIDADQAARDVVRPGTPGLRRVVDAFGSEVLDSEGGLDRKKMADLIFADPEARKKLNGIVHPLVGAEIARFIGEHTGEPILVLEIPLLLEGGRNGGSPVNKVVVVTTDEDARLERLKAKGFSPEEVEARLATQMPQEEKIALADHVIRNAGDVENTREQVVSLAGKYGVQSVSDN